MVNLKDIKANINVDMTDFIKGLRQLQEGIKMDDVRILKGYSKEERKELEYAKKDMYCNDLINNITGNPAEARCSLIGEKYTKAETDEQISIIRDILDFYTDKAKFAEPKKYYVHFLKSDGGTYLNINTDGEVKLENRLEPNGWKTKFTRDEVVAINPKFVPFMEEV